MRKCPHCEGDIIQRPISRQPIYLKEEGRTRINWQAFRWKNLKLKNLIIGDPLNLLIIFSVLFVAWAYAHDTETCRDIYEAPCGFVNSNYEFCTIDEQNDTYHYPIFIDSDLVIRHINNSEGRDG